MQNPKDTQETAPVDRFADRLLNALANLDRYANGYEKRDLAAQTRQPPASDSRDPG
ncbi:MAG: hypothetical protein JNL89_16780 [Rhodanobacteraceae bacterium]|nr:hypothetical protein [Rhodanobacteraceae bacterium]